MKKLYYHKNPSPKFSTKPKHPYWTNLSAVANWLPGNDDFNVAKVNLRERPAFKNSTKANEKDKRECQVLVCHDMAGGYTEDYFKIGYSVQIAVPPPQWTNVAHRNGVKVLGTFITEWARDLLENELWVRGPHTEAPLDDLENVNRKVVSTVFADKMVQMAIYYNFDGWFINIESPLLGGSLHAQQVITFMNYFTQQMHKKKPGSLVLWYDSITKEGTLSWQDQLNDLNYPYFDATDGIFVNYTWKEEYPYLSSQKAGNRRRNVYTGIDVWGRNTYGGGGFTTYKALEVIQKAKTSCALFAPAWTYEHFGKESFWEIDRKFWIGNADKDDDEDKGLAIAHYITPRYAPGINQFYTNFDRGCGNKFFIKGRNVLEQEWSHLSHQSIQPYHTKRAIKVLSDIDFSINYITNNEVSWEFTFDQAYIGGTSVLVKSKSKSSDQPIISIIPLFDLNITILPNGYMRARVTYLPKKRDLIVGLYIKVGIEETKQKKGKRLKYQKFETTIVSEHENWITIEVVILPNTFTFPSSSSPSPSIQEFGVSITQPPNLGNLEGNSHSTSTNDLVYIGQLSISSENPSLLRMIEPEIQNLYWDESTLCIEHIENQEILRISGIIEWEMGVQVVDYNDSNLLHTKIDLQDSSSSSSSDLVDIVNSFRYFYVYSGIKSVAKKITRPEELEFLGIADVNKFIISGIEVPVSKISKDTVLSIWVQGVKENNGEMIEFERWKVRTIPLSSFIG
ncbi:6005_t:CDS:10 [Diversispora eburnea]|uniref:6005_t:CDS:1 n=1 Tax=Diversispora eburnea TaxID=1213867 RepID=A0A9N8VG68_9GLOM|nr:6005_t:CDS:10 [Diversispora eburnea]